MSIFDFVAKVSIMLIDSCPSISAQITAYICSQDESKPDDDFSHLLESISVLSTSLIYDFDIFYNEAKTCIAQKKYNTLLYWLELADRIAGNWNIKRHISSEGIVKHLNSIDVASILIFPRVRRFHVWSHPADEFSGTLNQLLSKLLIVRINRLNGFDVINHYMDEIETDFIVSGSPITPRLDLIVNQTAINGVNCYSTTTQIENEDDFVQRLLEFIKRSDKEECSLVSFPELISTKDINYQIVEKLKSMVLTHVLFIALPTYYDNLTRHNVGDVYSVRHRQVIFSQAKAFPYVVNNIQENIVPAKELHLLHIPGIGVIAFPICRDALSRPYIEFCEEMTVSLVVIRSFTREGGIVFFNRIGCRYASFECCLFLVNSCALINGSRNCDTVGLSLHCKKPLDFKKYECQSNCDQCGHFLTL